MNRQAPGLQAVIVLYNCPPEDSPAVRDFYQAIRSYPGRVNLLLYDNSPKPASALPVLPGLNLVYQHDEHNSGVSRAYNEAAKQAVAAGMEWLLLLDQDTRFNQDYLLTFARLLAENSDCGLFAPVLVDRGTVVSPFRWLWGRGLPLKKEPQTGWLEYKNLALANSGLLISLEFFNRVGGYTEEITLDFSDIDFCLKAVATGEKFYLLPVTLEHTLSALTGADAVTVMIRLTRYTRCARLFAFRHGLLLPIGLRLAVKTLQLTLKFRSLRFVKIYLKEFFQRKGGE